MVLDEFDVVDKNIDIINEIALTPNGIPDTNSSVTSVSLASSQIVTKALYLS